MNQGFPPHISFPPMLVFEINNLQEKADLGLLIGIFDDGKFFWCHCMKG